LLLANGVFAAAEMAVVASRKARLRQLSEAGNTSAQAALELAESPNRFLPTVQVGITLVGVLAGAYGGATVAQKIAAAPARGPAFTRLEISGIHNAFRVTDKVYSGSQPEGDEAFVALAKLGVKTIISVDGSKPDVEAAHKHGLRYIHLPFGYDGVPTNRIVELAKAAETLSGPIFVHCHHGLPRGPTAVAASV
jgi:protein tyrosine phosphatase (PTP) superfamily phosphohydrolase (DUF442 family)